MTTPPEALAAGAGAILSGLMAYVPGLNVKFASLSAQAKSLIMGVLIVAVATGAAFWACHGPVSTCVNGLDWRTWLTSIGAALALNQSTHKILPETEAVKDAKP
jgi:high-affinity Fe2+/Pb2+ permease